MNEDITLFETKYVSCIDPEWAEKIPKETLKQIADQLIHESKKHMFPFCVILSKLERGE